MMENENDLNACMIDNVSMATVCSFGEGEGGGGGGKWLIININTYECPMIYS